MLVATPLWHLIESLQIRLTGSIPFAHALVNWQPYLIHLNRELLVPQLCGMCNTSSVWYTPNQRPSLHRQQDDYLAKKSERRQQKWYFIFKSCEIATTTTLGRCSGSPQCQINEHAHITSLRHGSLHISLLSFSWFNPLLAQGSELYCYV